MYNGSTGEDGFPTVDARSEAQSQSGDKLMIPQYFGSIPIFPAFSPFGV